MEDKSVVAQRSIRYLDDKSFFVKEKSKLMEDNRYDQKDAEHRY